MQQNKVHRIYINMNIASDDKVICNKEVSHRIKNVLRIKNRDRIILFNGNGEEYLGIVKNDKLTEIKIIEKKESIRPIRKKISLAQCVTNSRHMDFSIQKAVELGINSIIPILSERSLSKRHDKKIEHWEKVIIHAVEQSHAVIIPELKPAINFIEFIEKFKNKDNTKILLDKTGGSFNYEKYKSKNFILLVGPEGGFTDDEIVVAKNKNWDIISLGDKILRTETASVVGHTLLKYF